MALPDFDYDAFVEQYPTLGGQSTSATYSETVCTNIYTYQVLEICQPIINTFSNDTAAYSWACLALAHVLTLQTTLQVGRVESATQAPITTSFKSSDLDNAVWWNSTAYGAQCWQLLRQKGGGVWISGGSSYNGYRTGYYGY